MDLSPLLIVFVLQPLEGIVPFLSVGSAFRLSFGSPGAWAEKNRWGAAAGAGLPSSGALGSFPLSFSSLKVAGSGSLMGLLQ